MTILRYITHPEVVVDPDVPVPTWSLSATGRDRIVASLQQPWIVDIARVIASPETKALEAATIIADHLGLDVETRPLTGETDRSSTGFVPHARHELLAGQFFAAPAESAEGWERAVDAQTRIVGALRDVTAPGDQTVAVVGHGGVGTLLMCHLAGLAISREHDQPRQGHYWSYEREPSRLLHRWRRIDAV